MHIWSQIARLGAFLAAFGPPVLTETDNEPEKPHCQPSASRTSRSPKRSMWMRNPLATSWRTSTCLMTSPQFRTLSSHRPRRMTTAISGNHVERQHRPGRTQSSARRREAGTAPVSVTGRHPRR